MRFRNLVSESTLKCWWDTAKCSLTWLLIFWTWCKLVSPLTMQMHHLPFMAVMCTFEVDLAHYRGSYKIWNFTMIFLGTLIKVCHMVVLQIGSRWILAKKKKEKRKGKSFCRSQKELDSFKSTVSICYHDSFLPLAEIALENHVQITVLYIFTMCLQWVLGSWDLIVFFCVCCCGRSFKYLSKLYKCCWQLTCIAPFLRGSFIWQGRMILSHLCDEPKGLKTNMCLVWFVPFFTTEIICSLKSLFLCFGRKSVFCDFAVCHQVAEIFWSLIYQIFKWFTEIQQMFLPYLSCFTDTCEIHQQLTCWS
jgi:hypothetical protein